MPETDLTTIPDAIKKRRPHIDVRLYGNLKCPHCKGRCIHKVRKAGMGGPVLVLQACPMALVEVAEHVESMMAIRAYLEKELPPTEERERLNKSRKTKDKELKAFFAGVEHALKIIKDAQDE